MLAGSAVRCRDGRRVRSVRPQFRGPLRRHGGRPGRGRHARDARRLVRRHRRRACRPGCTTSRSSSARSSTRARSTRTTCDLRDPRAAPRTHPPRRSTPWSRRTAPLQNEPFIRERARELVDAPRSMRPPTARRHRGHASPTHFPSAVIAHMLGVPRRRCTTASASGPTSCSKRRTPEPAGADPRRPPGVRATTCRPDRRAARRARPARRRRSPASSAPTSTASTSPTARSARRRCSSSSPATRPRGT